MLWLSKSPPCDPNSNFSCWAMACADTISARRFNLGVWSPVTNVSICGIRSTAVSRTGGCIGLQRGDDSGLRNLVRPAVIHIDSLEQENVALLGHSGSHGLHDLPVDGLFIVG